MSKQTFWRLLVLVALAAVIWAALNNLEKLYALLCGAVAVLAPVIAGAAIAFVLNLPLRFFERTLLFRLSSQKLRRILAMVLSYGIVLAATALCIVVIIPQLTKSIAALMGNLPEYSRRLTAAAQTLSKKSAIARRLFALLSEQGGLIDESVTAYLSQLGLKAVNLTLLTAKGIFEFVLSVFFSAYILAQKEKLRSLAGRLLCAAVKREQCEKIKEIADVTGNIFSKFVTGQLLEAVLLGVLCAAGMLLIGLPYAALVGMIIGLTALVPIVGAWVGTLVSALLIFLESPLQALIFAIYEILLQQIENNVIYPKVVGDAVGISGLWVLFSVTVGGALFGVVGMIFAVPVFASLSYFVSRTIELKNDRSHSAPASGDNKKRGKSTNN